jgi:hypothetical protein
LRGSLAEHGGHLIEFDAPSVSIAAAIEQPEPAATSAVEALRKDERPKRPPGDPHPFILVYGRGRKFARLHKAKGGCHWASLALVESVSVQFVDASMYNAKCKLCWPSRVRVDAPAREGSSASGSESSSSESSL